MLFLPDLSHVFLDLAASALWHPVDYYLIQLSDIAIVNGYI